MLEFDLGSDFDPLMTLRGDPFVVYAHGLHGRPDGIKPTALQDAGFPVVAPDCRECSLEERVRLIEWESAKGNVLLIGSSYGGLAALVVATLNAKRICGMILIAPALLGAEPPVDDPEQLVIPPDLPTIVIHGKADEVVPIDVSRRLVARSGDNAQLIEVDDTHQLSHSIDVIVSAARALWPEDPLPRAAR